MQSDSVGVERRRLPFTLIENIILEDQELDAVDVLVYLALAKHANGEGTCWPSMATIARVARVCRSKAFQAIKHLEALGYLKRTARFRADGGVTSNVYQLMPIDAKRYPPVARKDTPCHPDRLPPVHQMDTNYTHSELDPNKERAIAQADKAPQSAQNPSHELAPDSLSFLLERIRQEAQARGAPSCFIAGGWSSGIRALMTGGVSGEEILKAFTACIETAPERATFFPRDYLKWRKVSREQTRRGRQLQHDKRETETIEREREAERKKILSQQSDPQGAARIEADLANLPWKRWRGGVRN